MIKVYINWSIYVRTSNLRKLREAHLPPIVVAYGPACAARLDRWERVAQA
jgi:hypothetical protein